MSKPAKPAAPAAEGAAAPAKSHKLLIIIIAVLALVIAGGAGWYFMRSHEPAGEHAAEAKPEPVLEPKYVPLGEKFTVNLQREEGDQYLQVGITLKVMQPELEEKIKARMPEIRSKLLLLLATKLPSELQTPQGKQKLIAEIIAETDAVLGIPPAPMYVMVMPSAPASASADEHGEHSEAAHAAPPAAAPAAPVKTNGVVDVLFTDFIIQ